MIQASNLPVSLDALLPDAEVLFQQEVARGLGVEPSTVREVRLLKRSIDARKKTNVHGVVTVAVKLADGVEPRPAKGVNVNPYDPPEPLHIPFVGKPLGVISQVHDGVSPCHPERSAEGMPPCHPERSAEGAESTDLSARLRPLVVGTGPAGLFCALYLAQAGLCPLVVERGAAVDERVNIVEAFNQGAPLDVRTNIQFGEGGAGTFSDGKLNTGIKSPHIRHVLEAFVQAGAPTDILVDAKPHIGTDLLVGVVRNLRCAIEEDGGEVRFLTRLDGLEVSNFPPHRSRVVGATLVDEQTGDIEVVSTDCVVLACGHSARDTFQMLSDFGVNLQRKPFAVGVRIEHPQALINEAQYGGAAAHPALGAADYKLAVKCADGRGVYTFCMCPGGEVVAASSEEGVLCVNGMSRRARGGENANSALLVEVRPDDLPGEDPLAGVAFQRKLERDAYRLGCDQPKVADDGADISGAQGKEDASALPPYTAPAQTVGAFLAGEAGSASTLVRPTYPRGIAWRNLRDCLPPFVAEALVEAIPLLDCKMHGFAHPQAVMTAVEARSSSPVRIVRDEAFQSNIAGLYPCGEGAGYAGGIMSAAVDGLRTAEAIVERADSCAR